MNVVFRSLGAAVLSAACSTAAPTRAAVATLHEAGASASASGAAAHGPDERRTRIIAISDLPGERNAVPIVFPYDGPPGRP